MRHNFNLSLVGQRVVLVPYRRAHVRRYHAWMQDPALLEATASDPLTLEEEVANQLSWRDDAKKLTFIVLDAARSWAEPGDEHEVDAMAGDVNLFFNDPDDPRVAEVEVMLAEVSCRRRGLATEAVALLLWYAAKYHGVTRFFCKIGEANEASLALFEGKLGFTRCGFAACFKEVELEHHVDPHAPERRPPAFVRAAVYTAGDDLPADDGGAETLDAAAAVVAVENETQDEPPPPASVEAPANAASPPRVPPAHLAGDEPRVQMRVFGGVVGDGVTTVHFAGQLMLLSQSCFLSLVEQQDGAAPAMGPLCVSMATRFDKMPLSTTLLGQADDDAAQAVAQHLARRTGMQCFVTCSLPEAAMSFLPEIERHVFACLEDKRPPSPGGAAAAALVGVGGVGGSAAASEPQLPPPPPPPPPPPAQTQPHYRPRGS